MGIVNIEGSYVLVDSENFDEYLKSCGVNFIVRAIAKQFKPVLEVCQDGEYWVWRTVTPLKTIVIRYRFGESFETDFPDGSGRKVVAKAVKDKNKITVVMKLEDKTIIDVKEFTDHGMVTTLKLDDVVAIRTYRKL